MSAPATTGRYCAMKGLSPETYRPHAMHGEQAVWVEKNCYVDVWIELVHALGLEPAAAMAFALAVDFEGDHWTFFKPPHSDLHLLYGIDVQELNVWRPLLAHAAEHLAAGKLLSAEADSFWLPDTAGTDYQRQHVKTTIVLNDLDVDAQRLGYFHSAGYHALEGEDFRQLFNLSPVEGGPRLPFFVELVRTDRLQRLSTSELARRSRRLLEEHHARRPATNPVARFATRFAADLPWLHEQGLDHYHAWAFTTTRQMGAAFELAANHARWLAPHVAPELAQAAERFELIAQEAKSMILKVARVVNAKRAFDPHAALAPLVTAWDEGMALLGQALQR